MTKEEIKELPEKQVQLLSKRTNECFSTDADLAEISRAMLDICDFLIKHFT